MAPLMYSRHITWCNICCHTHPETQRQPDNLRCILPTKLMQCLHALQQHCCRVCTYNIPATPHTQLARCRQLRTGVLAAAVGGNTSCPSSHSQSKCLYPNSSACLTTSADDTLYVPRPIMGMRWPDDSSVVVGSCTAAAWAGAAAAALLRAPVGAGPSHVPVAAWACRTRRGIVWLSRGCFSSKNCGDTLNLNFG